MANISYLQLYLDTDYLLPVVVGADGNLVKFQDKQGESRLWLFFQKSSGREVYESGASHKANYEARIQGSLGDFWKHVDAGDKVEGEPFCYEELLELAGLLDTLRNWCRPMLGTPTPQVVLNFAATIGVKARLTLVEYLQKKGFAIRSYSIEINELMAEKVAHDHYTMGRTFGDQLLVLQSTGDMLLLSTMTWCGDIFLQCDKPAELTKQCDDLRTTLATMVVKKMESYYNRLQPHEIPYEISYQTQFADEWLKCRTGDVICVRGFHYSSSPGKVSPPQYIDARQLDYHVEDSGREIINQVKHYYSENLGKANHLHTILVGDMFLNEIFCQNCVEATESQKKFTFFNDNALQEAMGRYYFIYADLEESVSELEKRYLTKETERQRIRAYVMNAQMLGSLRSDIAASKRAVECAIEGVRNNTKELQQLWTALMSESRFEEARKCIAHMSTDDLTVAHNQLMQTLARVEASSSLFTDLKHGQQHVKDIVAYIEGESEQLKKLDDEAKGLELLPTELLKCTQHYEEMYPVYLDLKKNFSSEPSLAGKRRIREQMVKVTMEQPPQVEVEVVNIDIVCEVNLKGGLFSRKKAESLKIIVQVKDGGSLPFTCVLIVSSQNQPKLNRNGWNADLEKGGQQWSHTISASEISTDEDGYCVVQIFPDEANAHLKKCINYDKKRIKVK